MAVSAYTPQGLLKKNALLGTSLAVDPNQQATRQGFEDLYGEAKTAAQHGATRQETLNQLQSRVGAQAADTSSRLSEIARMQGQFQNELSASRDPAKEKELQTNLAKWQAYNKGLTPKNWKGLAAPGAMSEASAAWKAMTPTERFTTTQKMGSKKGFIKDYVLGGAQRAKDAAAAYEAKFNATVDRINEQYIPLQEEAADRQQRLADRIDLYNLFLGNY